MHIIDCTLRDGGFHNNWNFTAEFIGAYFDVISSIDEIEYIEIGYRKPSRERPNILSNVLDNDIEQLSLPKNKKVALIINAHDFTSLEEIDLAFTKNSPIDLLRVACYEKDLDWAIEILKNINGLPYKKAISFMKADTFDLKKIMAYKDILKKLDSIYFADSYGTLMPEQYGDIFAFYKSLEINVDFGVHTHDNKNLAKANIEKMIDSGGSWFDVTVLGMGRGAGNCPTEQFFTNEKMKIFIEMHMKPLYQKYKWGASKLFEYAGCQEIHPLYSQYLNIHTDEENAISVMGDLKKRGVHKKFDPMELQKYD